MKPKVVYYKKFKITIYNILGKVEIRRKGFAKINGELNGNWRRQLRFTKKYIDGNIQIVSGDVTSLSDTQLRRLCYNPGMFRNLK